MAKLLELKLNIECCDECYFCYIDTSYNIILCEHPKIGDNKNIQYHYYNESIPNECPLKDV